MAIAYVLASKQQKPANDSFSDIVTELFTPAPFVADREGSEASKK
jgi:hypothetical protein